MRRRIWIDDRARHLRERLPIVVSDLRRTSLDVSGDGRGCNRIVGRFQVYEVEVAGNSYVVGAVRFESTRPQLLPFDGAYPIDKLTIAPAVNGTVTGTGINCGPSAPDCTETFATATSVGLQAVPAQGYRFIGWSGACDGHATTAVVVKWIRRCAAVFSHVHLDQSSGRTPRRCASWPG